MITFHVAREAHGWAVRMGEGATSPFRSRALAIGAANSLAAAIRRHGAGVVVDIDAFEPPLGPPNVWERSPGQALAGR